MYAVAERLDPDRYFALARAVYAEMALAGHHLRRRVPLPAPWPGREFGIRDPNELGRLLIAAAAAAGLRITLLDTCYLAGGFAPGGEARPLAGVQLRFGDGTAAAWAERIGRLRLRPARHDRRARAARRRDPLGPRGAAGPGARRDGLVARARRAGARAPVGAAAGERGVPGRLRRDACRGAVRGGRARPALHDGARHAPDAARRGAARRVPDSGMHVPGHRGRPGGRHRARPRARRRAAARCRWAATGTASSTCWKRRAGWSCRSGWRPGGAATSPPADLAVAATVSGHACLGWPDAGEIVPGAYADLVTVPLDGAPAGRGRRRTIRWPRCSPRGPRRTSGTWWPPAWTWSATAATCWWTTCPVSWPPRSARCSPKRPPPVAGSLLITRIGELVTNAPADAGAAAGPGRVRGAQRRGAGHRGRPGRVDRARRPGRPPPTRWWTRQAARCCPGSSTRTRTWCSRASGAPSSRRGWPACRTRPAASGPRSLATRAATDAAAARGAAAAGGRDAAAGDHDVRVQVRVRPHGGRRGPVGGAGGRGHRRGDVPRRARGAPRVRRRRQRLRRPGPRADARGVRAVLALGGRVLRARRVRRGRGARRADGGPGARAAAADPREPAGYRARDPAGRGAGRRLRRPLHVPHRRRRGALASSDTVATLLPGAEFGTRQPYPDARRLLDAGAVGRPGHRLQSRLLVHLEHAVLHRARGPRHADDHGGSGLVRDRGRRPRAAPHRRRLPGARRARRPDHAGRPVARLPRLPPGRPAGPHRLAIRSPRFRGNAVTARR